MNTIIKKKNKATYINLWHAGTDSLGKKFPKPKNNKHRWKKQALFEENFNFLEQMSEYKKYKSPKHCKLCKEKNITKGVYYHNDIMWEDGLSHYVTKHNVNVPKKFRDYVTNMQNIAILKFKNIGIKKLKLKRNQLNIMDALLYSGGDRTIYENKKGFYYSEHFGLLDFNKKGLETILVDANTDRVDEGDETILMPTIHRTDIYDYEYIFHTHPPEKNKPGGRVEDGILYEFPSMNDIFHFIYYHNNGSVNGSIINSAEGLYIIRSTLTQKKKVDLSEKVEDQVNEKFANIQDHAIKKYGTDFTDEYFYSVIAQNTSYIKKINKILKKDHFVIDFYPRVKNKKKKWVLPEITISVDVVEPF